jgi:NitT/TauT family transport system substrate-binding protein
MKGHSKLKVKGAYVVLLLLTLFYTTSALAQKLTLAYTSADAIYGPWFYAQDMGYFKKHGLDTTLVFFDTGSKGVQALVGGSVDVCACDGYALPNAKFAGADVIFIGVTLGVLTGNVYAAKDITEPAQLKGKKWGISSFGSEAHTAARLSLAHFGLSENDVTIVQLGNQGNRLAALEAGQISVSTFLPPISARVEELGYHKLAELPKIAPNYFSIGPAVSMSLLQTQRANVKTFLMAMAEATAAYKKDKANGVLAIQHYLKSEPKDAEIAWSYYTPLHPINLRPSENSFAIQLANSPDPKAKTAKFSDFVDLSLLDELDKEGFFKKLE